MSVNRNPRMRADGVSCRITLSALEGLPLVKQGDDLATMIAESLERGRIEPDDQDIIVVAQKIVSKAEGRVVDLNTVSPGARAREIAEDIQKDARIVELILSESTSIIRLKPGVIIVEHKLGWIMANAGIDASNVASDDRERNVLLLPVDPDKSAATLRTDLKNRFGCELGVVISDSFGRPWRLGTTGVAIGAAGLPSLWDRRGESDLFGREMLVTQQAIADEVATAASLLQGQGSEGRPVVHIRGLTFDAAPRPASDLIRDAAEDMFR